MVDAFWSFNLEVRNNAKIKYLILKKNSVLEYWNHKKVTLDEVFKGAVLVMEAAMMEPQTQICGAVVIFDMDGLTLQQTWQFTPPFAKRIVDWLQVIIAFLFEKEYKKLYDYKSLVA